MDEKYKYLGGGFVIGVPARDLTNQEVKDLPEDLKEQVKKSGLYKPVKEKSEDQENAK